MGRNKSSEGMRATAVELVDGNVAVELDQLVNSVPNTGTFHHLGHEGKVFIHSSRHDDLANDGNFDHLIRLPAGESGRQVHMRFNVFANAITGSLDVNGYLYKDTTVSDYGSEEAVVSTNDAIVRTTGVKIYSGHTLTDIGTLKARTWNVGEKKGAGNTDQAVPEWILAPNGESERLYTFRINNVSNGNVDFVLALFFYDTHSVLV